MLGKMMHQPLIISALISHAAKYHADTPIISRETSGELDHTNWASVDDQSRRLLSGLRKLGLKHGDRIGTIAWNNHRHLKSWFAISGGGMVCHTLNPRLPPEQLIFIVNDANDKAMLFDKTFAPLIAATRAHLSSVEHFIFMGGHDPEIEETVPGAVFFDDLVREDPADWPELDENTPCSLCYTSGTTGNPKGVLYYHRCFIRWRSPYLMP